MHRGLFVALLLLATSAPPASAQPVPAFVGMTPIYLRQGETRDVTVAGNNLGGATAVLLPEANGIAATLATPAKPKDAPKIHLVASTDAALGDRELRLATPFGVTQPLTVTIGQLPAIAEAEPNDSGEAAQWVELPASLLGKIERPGDVDVYRFTAKKGRRLIFDAHARRLGSPFEPLLTLQTAAGRELPRRQANHGGDPMIAFDVPEDGDYLLHIRDLRYRGGDFGYRIEAGEIPYVEAVVPSSGKPGDQLELTAIGHNLKDHDRIVVDLTAAAPGPILVRAKTPAGLSNAVPFFVTDQAAAGPKVAGPATQPVATEVPSKPGDQYKVFLEMPAIAVPSELTGVLLKPGAEHSYPFTIKTKQPLTLAVHARPSGSPLDALLTLKTAKGDVIEQSNGAADFEAKISRALDPGDYIVSVRDLTFAGGPAYVYRLTIGAEKATPEYTVRFMPDSPRVPRGGNAKMWCEVSRAGGVRGPVTITLEGLPAGVKAGPATRPVTIDDVTSGLFTISAAAKAELGTFPIRVIATATGNLKRTAGPELNGRIVSQAYLTVTEAAPVEVAAVDQPKAERVAEYTKQIAELKAKMAAAGPAVEAKQAAWEEELRSKPQAAGPWTVLAVMKPQSAGGAVLTPQIDGSLKAGGGDPDRDTFTFAATTDLKPITAIRLEALGGPELPGGGPGRAPNGNFVLSKMTVMAAPQSDPGQAQPVAFGGADADFSQQGYPAGSAVGVGSGGGWAVVPETGKSHVAVFRLASPVGFDGGTVLHFTMDHQFGQKHVLGQIRLSVASDPKPPVELGGGGVPPQLLAIAKMPTTQRTAEQKTALADYYRSISPELAADRARLAELQSLASPPKLTVGKNKALTIPVPIVRRAGFTGDVQITLEGFSAGRDPASRQPTGIVKNMLVTPLTIKGNASFGNLNLKTNGNSELGTRMVVLRAETKVGNDTWVQYSPAFPLTVTEK